MQQVGRPCSDSSTGLLIVKMAASLSLEILKSDSVRLLMGLPVISSFSTGAQIPGNATTMSVRGPHGILVKPTIVGDRETSLPCKIAP